MMFYNAGPRSAGDFFNQLNWLSGMLYKIYPNPQKMLHQKNRISMMLYNTGSRSAGAFIPVELDQQDAV